MAQISVENRILCSSNNMLCFIYLLLLFVVAIWLIIIIRRLRTNDCAIIEHVCKKGLMPVRKKKKTVKNVSVCAASGVLHPLKWMNEALLLYGGESFCVCALKCVWILRDRYLYRDSLPGTEAIKTKYTTIAKPCCA